MNETNISSANGHDNSDSGLIDSTQGLLAVGSWGRRLNKRYVAEAEYRDGCVSKQRDIGVYDGIQEVAGEMDDEPMGITTTITGAASGKQVQRRKSILNNMGMFKARGISKEGQSMRAPEAQILEVIEAKPGHEGGGKKSRRVSKFIEHTTTVAGDTKSDEQGEATESATALSLLSTNSDIPSRKQRQLSEPTEMFKVLMLGEKQRTIAYRTGSQLSAATVPLKRTLSKLCPPRMAAINIPAVLHIGLSPQKDKVTGGTDVVPRPAGPGTVRVNGVQFDMMTPQSKALPSITQTPRRVPPRTTSRNFNVLPPKLTKFFLLPKLPQKIRKKIFALIIVAKHEILVCTCGYKPLSALTVQGRANTSDHQFLRTHRRLQAACPHQSLSPVPSRSVAYLLRREQLHAARHLRLARQGQSAGLAPRNVAVYSRPDPSRGGMHGGNCECGVHDGDDGVPDAAPVAEEAEIEFGRGVRWWEDLDDVRGYASTGGGSRGRRLCAGEGGRGSRAAVN